LHAGGLPAPVAETQWQVPIAAGLDRWAKPIPVIALSARVSALVAVAKSFDGDVRVDLGRAEAGMPKKLLNRPEIGASIKKVRGGTVSQ